MTQENYEGEAVRIAMDAIDVSCGPTAAAVQKGSDQPVPKKDAKKAPFDMARYPQRHVVLRIAYHGHNHEGLAKQDHTENTIETLVCNAMIRVRLVPESGPVKFSRCGRTDKGVSALGNAFSMMIRASADDKQPLDYCNMINNGLPPTVRVTGWCFVPDDFDARFSCQYRVYRYYFATEGLNLDAMREAASHLIGSHNFRNFCKLDVVNVDNFVREIQSVEIRSTGIAPQLISYCEIRGNAFLYHQIRCTMSVLFLVGRGLETPDVVRHLLQRGDAKPIYPLADDSPLILWDCHFDPSVVTWTCSPTAMRHMLAELSDIHVALQVRAAASFEMRHQMTSWWTGTSSSTSEATEEASPCAADDGDVCWTATGCDWTSERLQGGLRRRQHEMFAARKRNRGSSYIPLLEREVEATFAEKVKGLGGTKKARHEENQSKKQAYAANSKGGDVHGERVDSVEGGQ